MNRLVKCNRDQAILFSKTIAEHLGQKHEIFGFIKLIDSLDLKPFLKHYSAEGGKAYYPSLILSVLIYGYHRGWRSSRVLQRACEENDAMRYLVGDHRIKYRAIAEFRITFAEEIADVFKQSVGQVVTRRPSIGKDVKVDGTKIKAMAANDQTYTKKELAERKALIEKKILDYLDGGIADDKREDIELGDNDGSEIDVEETNKRIADFIAKQKQLKRQHQSDVDKSNSAKKPKTEKPTDPNQLSIFTAAKKLQKINVALEKAADLADDANINLTDTDARFMKNGGKIKQSFNAQVASSEGFIIAADIARGNSENDLEQLAPTLEAAQKNISSPIEKVTTDSGYFHASGLNHLEKNKIEGFIPSPQQTAKERKQETDSGYESHYFTKDEKSNSLICPKGKPLHFHREFTESGNKYFSFHCKPIHCVPCPLRSLCCTTKEDLKRGYRSLELGDVYLLKHTMILKMKTAEAKKIYKKRGAEIEPIFGNLKQLRNFREFLLRGIKKVETELKITSTAFNFGKIVRLAMV